MRRLRGGAGGGSNGAGSTLRVVNSCLLFLPMLAGQEVYTVEGLARDGRLSEPQRAIAEHGGSQCGYCTPGFAVSLFAEYHRPGRTGPATRMRWAAISAGARGIVRCAMPRSGSGCRRTTIFNAGCGGRAPPVGAFSLPHAEFAFERPASLADCLALLDAHPEACLVAGATDLAVEANLRGRRWPLLVSVEAVPELRVFRDADGEVEIGAGLTLSEIEARWVDAPPVMHEWFELFASPLIRNRATLGGNLATASPVGDAAPLLLALDAQVNLASREGRRRIPLSEFFLGLPPDGAAAGGSDGVGVDSEAVSAERRVLQSRQARARRHQHGGGSLRSYARSRGPRGALPHCVRGSGGDARSASMRPKMR